MPSVVWHREMAALALTNTEWKAEVTDDVYAALRARFGKPDDVLEQTDTYFARCIDGVRLKMRTESSPRHGLRTRLILYSRSDAAASRVSDVTIVDLSSTRGTDMTTVLAAAHGIDVVVRKHRLLFMRGKTRIHLDSVEGLGKFVEVEVQRDGKSSAQASDVAEADALRAEFGIEEGQLRPASYRELCMARVA